VGKIVPDDFYRFKNPQKQVLLPLANTKNMNSLLIINIHRLYQTDQNERTMVKGPDMSEIPYLEDAYLLVDNGKIAAFGPMISAPSFQGEILDATGKMVVPAWCDAHTHLVFPSWRETEFVDRLKGLSYEEIARRGGGILHSAEKMKTVGEEELFQSAMIRLNEMARWGTGAVEIKSGYGLSTQEELKMLRVIKRLKRESALTIKSTFLGAHAMPGIYKTNRNGYIDLIIHEMLPQIAREELADFVDVFCDQGFYTVEETGRILQAAHQWGLRPKIHANELGHTGGIEVGVKYNALSVDHLEFTGQAEIDRLKNSDTMPTILPGAAFFLGMPLAPARAMIDAGLPVALASDYNPGSSPSGNLQLIMAMGSIQYRMLPEEVLNSVTINGAYAMGVERELGTIAIGKRANITLLKQMPSLAYLTYAYGENKVDTLIINGKIVKP
jgi:imidazolonepropionase